LGRKTPNQDEVSHPVSGFRKEKVGVHEDDTVEGKLKARSGGDKGKGLIVLGGGIEMVRGYLRGGLSKKKKPGRLAGRREGVGVPRRGGCKRCAGVTYGSGG